MRDKSHVNSLTVHTLNETVARLFLSLDTHTSLRENSESTFFSKGLPAVGPELSGSVLIIKHLCWEAKTGPSQFGSQSQIGVGPG